MMNIITQARRCSSARMSHRVVLLAAAALALLTQSNNIAHAFVSVLISRSDGRAHAHISPFLEATTSSPRIRRETPSVAAATTSRRAYDDDDDDDDDDEDDEFDTPLLRPPRNRANGPLSSTQQQQPLPLPAKSHFFSQKSLTDPSFRLFRVVEANAADPVDDDVFARLCRGAGIDRPSKIQSMAWPVLLNNGKKQQQKQSSASAASATVIADQTGSGKTLAYLIPLLQRVILSSSSSSSEQPTKRTATDSTTTSVSAAAAATPRLLILAPTAELADQIRAVCQKLSEPDHESRSTGSSSISRTTTKNSKKPLFSTVVLTASGKHATNIRDQIRLLQLQKQSVDVLISTPGRIATILRTKHAAERVLDLRQLQAVVLDEVDVLLLDETFGPQLQTIGDATAPTTPTTDDDNNNNADDSMTQFVFVTATLPDAVVAQVQAQFPGTVLVKGPGLHRVAPTVQERLIDVSVPSALNRDAVACFDAKAKALQQALRQNRCKRTLVFCNTVATCRQVENLLQRMDRKNQIYTVRSYHNAMTAQARNENLEFFAKAGGGGGDYDSATAKKKANAAATAAATADATSYVLVCTDRAARGVDFAAAAVDHVVIFDFPVDPAEYVRRVGRTARAGRDGASTVLAYGWQLPIARSVMMGQQLKDSSYSSNNNNNNSGGGGGGNKASNNRADDNDGDDDDEYMGGVKGRRKTIKQGTKGNKPSSSNSIIGGNIASGKLWIEKSTRE